MPDIVFCSYGDLEGVRGVVMPFSRGCSPSVGTLFVRPQDGINKDPATLTFGTGDFAIELPDCALGTSYVRGTDQPVMCFQIADRRWRWKFTSVSGNYNARLASGLVDPFTAKTPGELAAIILTQMGEFDFDVSRMPTGVYPPANWNATKGNIALADLCERVACEVVLNPLTNHVEIWPLGIGSVLPQGIGETHPKWRYIPKADTPSTIEVHCGESLFQYRLKLESVGRGTNLLQTRTPDWMAGLNIATQSLNFPGVDSSLKSSLALATGHRHYRVAGQEGGGLEVPGLGVTITNTRQYILKDHVIFSALDDRTERYQELPYYIEGDFWPYGDLATNTTNQVYVGPSTLYADRNLVEFPFPVIKIYESDGTIQEPTLYLQTAYAVEDEQGNRSRYVFQANVGGAGGKLVLHRPEIQAVYAQDINTEAQAFAEASRYAEIFQQKYQAALASELTYRGVVPVTLDGNLAQCTWFVYPHRAPATRVSEVEECSQFSTGRAERRRREQLAGLLEAR